MAQQEFGGEWTQEKLERLAKYLPAYMKIFTKNPNAQFYNTYYVDAFAGSGYSVPKSATFYGSAGEEAMLAEAQSFLKGSPIVALEIPEPFGNYLFIEKETALCAELEGVKNEFPHLASRIQIVNDDASNYLTKWCDLQNWKKTRAVVFLDPFGMEVSWSLLETIANTKAIDLWLLFPLAGINRHLTTRGLPPPDWCERLDRVLGTKDWIDEFYAPEPQLNLFSASTEMEKVADFNRLAAYVVQRLETIFAKVAPNPLVLSNSTNAPLFLLCFAAGYAKAADTAVRIAQHILKDERTWQPTPPLNGRT